MGKGGGVCAAITEGLQTEKGSAQVFLQGLLLHILKESVAAPLVLDLQETLVALCPLYFRKEAAHASRAVSLCEDRSPESSRCRRPLDAC